MSNQTSSKRRHAFPLALVAALAVAFALTVATPLFAQPETTTEPTGDGDGDGDADTDPDSNADTATGPRPAGNANGDDDSAPRPRLGTDQFEIIGQVRVRAAWLSDIDPYFRTRARVGVIWTPLDEFEIAVVIQDIRRFGGFGTTLGVDGNTDLFEAYFHWQPFEVFAIQLGRITLAYDAERLIGALDWEMPGRRFDTIRFRFGEPDHESGISADLFWTPITTDLFGGSGPGSPGLGSILLEWLAGVHVVLPVIELHALSVYLYDYDRDPNVTSPQGINTATLGVYFARTQNSVVYDAEVAIQVGTIDNQAGTNFAWAGHFTGGYAFDEIGLKIVAEGNIASGEKVGTPQTEQFHNLFPTNHDKYGFFDRQNWSNTINAALRIWYDLKFEGAKSPLKLELSAWIFFRMEGTGSPDGFIGLLPPSASDLKAVEIDLLASHSFEQFFSALFGVSVWIPGDLAQAAGFNNTELFIYGQFHFNLP